VEVDTDEEDAIGLDDVEAFEELIDDCKELLITEEQPLS
jgi:hypothetical protein